MFKYHTVQLCYLVTCVLVEKDQIKHTTLFKSQPSEVRDEEQETEEKVKWKPLIK